MIFPSRIFQSTAALLLLGLTSCGGGDDSSTDNSSAFSVFAGPDLEVLTAETVRLSGTASGAGLDLAWSQVSGPAVEIVATAPAEASFVSPGFGGEVLLRLEGRSAGSVVAADEVLVTVRTVRGAEPFVSRAILPLDGGAATPVDLAYSAASMRAFVIDGASQSVLVVDLTDPASPQQIGALAAPALDPPLAPGLTSGFTPGSPTKLAVGGAEFLAVAYDALIASEPGVVTFYDPVTLLELATFAVAPRPTDLAFASGAPRLAVVSAADPVSSSGTALDGEGTVTLFEIPPSGPASIDVSTDVTVVDFRAFNGRRAELLADGVRLARPGVEVSRDLEPRSIALDPSGARAWVGLPANGAMAIIDFTSASVASLRGLDRADFGGAGLPASAEVLRRVSWTEGRPISTVTFGAAGDFDVPELDIAAIDLQTITGDRYSFAFVMGRGPAFVRNSSLFRTDTVLADPDFQHRIVHGTVDFATGAITVDSELLLRGADGLPVTARPNIQGTSQGLAYYDDTAFGPDGATLDLDPNGAILTGIVNLGGELWCADARRPSLMRFDASGRLVERYVPAGSNQFGPSLGAETLPARYAQAISPVNSIFRGGFQGLTEIASSGLLATVCRQPLDNPDTVNSSSTLNSRIVRLLVIDPTTGVPRHEYALALGVAGARIADIAWIDFALHVVEENQCSGARSLVRLDLSEATDLLNLGADGDAINAALEATDPDDLATAFSVPVAAVKRTLVTDLSAAGLSDGSDFSVHESPNGVFFATSDAFGFPELVRAFGDSVDCAQRLVSVAVPSVGEIRLRPRAMDPSGADGGAGPRSVPVEGWRQVVDIVTSPSSFGERVLYAVDGHLVRSAASLPESARIRDLALDTLAFPDAATLQSDAEAGPLVVSTTEGDANADGLYEELFAFGGRSLLALDGELGVLRDSGDTLERGLRQRFPADLARLEAGAPTGATSPARAHLLQVDRSLAVAFRDAGKVAFFDIASQASPLWTDVIPTQSDAAPTAVTSFQRVGPGVFERWILVTDEANGTLDVIEWLP